MLLVTLWLAGVPAGYVFYSVSFYNKGFKLRNSNFGSTVNIVAILLFVLLINYDMAG